MVLIWLFMSLRVSHYDNPMEELMMGATPLMREPFKLALTLSIISYLIKKIVNGMVTKLSKVVTKVVNEVKSGFTLNCTANRVVFAAMGMAAKRI
jgi:hypothetical protein